MSAAALPPEMMGEVVGNVASLERLCELARAARVTRELALQRMAHVNAQLFRSNLRYTGTQVGVRRDFLSAWFAEGGALQLAADQGHLTRFHGVPDDFEIKGRPQPFKVAQSLRPAEVSITVVYDDFKGSNVTEVVWEMADKTSLNEDGKAVVAETEVAFRELLLPSSAAAT